MDLRILTATVQAARTASRCGENATLAVDVLETACAAYDGTGESVTRIRCAADRLSAYAAAFSRCADAAFDNAYNICKD